MVYMLLIQICRELERIMNERGNQKSTKELHELNCFISSLVFFVESLVDSEELQELVMANLYYLEPWILKDYQAAVQMTLGAFAPENSDNLLCE